MAPMNPPANLPADLRAELTQAFGFVPTFVNAVGPNEARLWWTMVRDFQLSEKTALPGKVKELIGLAVSAQIPCHYCILFHTEAARLNGATEQEIQEAVFMAAVTRAGSTILNGTAVPQDAFDRDLERIVEHVKAQAAPAPAKGKVAVKAR